MNKKLIISNWQKIYTEDYLRKFGLELEDFTVEDDRIGCRFGIDAISDPLAEYPFVISNQQKPLYWLDQNREHGRILHQLYPALCFREKYLKFENPEEFNKHKVVDGNKTNIFALSLLDPVTNVEELVNCFSEIAAFFRSDLKINFNPLIKISFDGVRSTTTTIGGMKIRPDDFSQF